MNPILEKRLFTVVQNIPLATDAFQLTLVPVPGTAMFPFVAGQWVYLYLLNADGSEWGRAAFSIASAPAESNNQIELALKIHGDCTRRAQQLPIGAQVRIQGPFGVFTLRPGSAPLVMCAGGIGIAPFRSMVRELAASHDPRPVTLFYSNQTRDTAAYIKELTSLTAQNPQIRFVPIYTREHVEGAEGRHFDGPMLNTYVQNPADAEYLTCGPETLMSALKEILIGYTIDPKQKLRKELFE